VGNINEEPSFYLSDWDNVMGPLKPLVIIYGENREEIHLI